MEVIHMLKGRFFFPLNMIKVWIFGGEQFMG